MLTGIHATVKGHFSYVTPLPIEFPFGVPDKMMKELQEAGQDKVDLESLLAKYEPSLHHALSYGEDAARDGNTGNLQAYTSPLRSQELSKAELFGLSQRCVSDCLPDLDLGDALEAIKNPNLMNSPNAARDQLFDVLSGRVVAASLQDEFKFAPWSLCYGGHQFGSWASQLGDGRAISILTTPAPQLSPSGNTQPPQVELQLKGAGRTPYSRFADGLAVLRSSVREFLGSEAVAALDIPTSRALSLCHLPDVKVTREEIESAAVVCRIAPSWLRIGNFQIQHVREEWDHVLQLAQFAAKQVMHLDGDTVGKPLLREVARRNAIMVAAWQVSGFMHVRLRQRSSSRVIRLTPSAGSHQHRQRVNSRSYHRLWAVSHVQPQILQANSPVGMRSWTFSNRTTSAIIAMIWGVVCFDLSLQRH